MTRSINVGLLSPSNMESKGSGHDFLELLVSAAPDYRPIYYNDHEPINRSFDVSDVDKALEIWGWNFLWRGVGSRVAGSIWANHKIHSSVYLDLSPSVFNRDQVLNLISAMSERFQVDFAYIHVQSKLDLIDINAYKATTMPYVQGVTTYELDKGLPSVCWGMFLGPPYIQLFGESLKSAPASLITKMPGGVYLQLSSHFSDRLKSEDEYRRLQQAVTQHIGYKFFNGRHFDVRPQVPEFCVGCSADSN